MRMSRLKLIPFFAAAILITAPAVDHVYADPLPGGKSGSAVKPIDISGQVGAMSEFNTISGRERRRPGSTGRLFLKPSISIYNTLDINLNLFISTEGSGARQNMNEVDLNPRWGWGEAHLVDFTDNYSQFTLNGIKIRGAGLDLNPGLFRMSFVSGISKREINGTVGTKSYRRRVNGGRIGIGREGGSFLDFIVVSAKDNFSASDSVMVDSASIQDSTGIDTTQNPTSITPQENLVGALVSNLSLAESKFTWKNEISGSAFTRDRRSAEWELKNYPGSLKGIFTPRLGTSVDYAFSTEIGLNLSNYNFQGGYQYIGPGYVSLGLSSQTSDRQIIKLGFNRRLGSGALRLNFSRQNDNLIGQKNFTTARYNVSTGAAYKPLPVWNINMNLAYMTMSNDAPDSSTRVDFKNRVIQITNNFAFGRERGLRNISIDYSYQSSDDSDPARINSLMRSHVLTLRGTAFLDANISVDPSVNLTDTRQGAAGWSLTRSFSAGLNVQSFEKRLINNVMTGITFNGLSTSAKFGFRSSYEITRSARLSGQIDVNNFTSKDNSGNFTETTARLTAIQRF